MDFLDIIYLVVALIIGGPLIFVFFYTLFTSLTGHDIFISYSRSDGYLYANKLANELSKFKFRCFIDQWENDPGVNLSNRLVERLKRSRMLVIIGTPAAQQSSYVEEEIVTFLKTKRQIIPIIFGDVEGACWYQLIRGLPIVNLEKTQIHADHVDNNLTDRIKSSFKHVKRINLLNRSYGVMFAFLVASLIAVFYSWQSVQAQNKENKALFENLFIASKASAKRSAELDSAVARAQRNTSTFMCESEIQSIKLELIMSHGKVLNMKSQLQEARDALKKCQLNHSSD